jgi:hypothetical protein
MSLRASHLSDSNKYKRSPRATDVRVQNSKLDFAKLRRDYYVRDLPFRFYCLLEFTLLKYKLWSEHKMENLNNITQANAWMHPTGKSSPLNKKQKDKPHT